MPGRDRWMAKRLTPGQSSQLLIAYRATFTADNHGDALKAMYSKFEVAFGVPRNVLHAEVMADRQAHAKLYRKLRNELNRRASARMSTDSDRPPSTSNQTPATKRVSEAQVSDVSRPKPVRCPECNRRLAHAAVQHYGKKPGRLCGGVMTRKPTPMAETLAKWNIELEPEYLRPPGQRVHKLVVNLDTGKWQTTGVLGALGYHVGKNGIDQRTRRAILTEAVEVKLVAASPEFVDYVNGWGAPKSRKRIVKIRDSIRAFAQIRRSTKADYSGALADWDSDLAWLKAKYQV
jgi:hypothetical protein